MVFFIKELFYSAKVFKSSLLALVSSIRKSVYHMGWGKETKQKKKGWRGGEKSKGRERERKSKPKSLAQFQ